MAFDAKNFLDLTGLTSYDGLIKQYIRTEDNKQISILQLSADGNYLNAWKNQGADPATDTPDYHLALGGGDLADMVRALAAIVPATYDSTNKTYSITGLSTTATNTLVAAINEIDGHADTNTAAIGTLGSLSTTTKTDLVSAINEVFTKIGTDIAAAIGGLDYTVAASGTNAVLTGFEVEDGVLKTGSVTSQALKDVAISGKAEDVAYNNTDSGLTATDVQGAIDELAEASAGGVASKTVYMVASGATTDYAQVYDIYQGANGSSASPVAAEKIGTINIPKDKVVESGSVGTVTIPDVPYPGAQVGDKYIELVLQNVADPLYIPANSLVDIYTGGTTAEATVTIDNSNEITVTIVEINGSKLTNASVAKGKLASGVQASLDLADSAIQSVTEGSTNGTISVDGTDVAVHGLGSAAYTASTAYDPAGEAEDAYDAIGSIPTASIKALFD